MLKVGLTGGIACGKTVVRRRLETMGVETLDADSVVHELLGRPGEVTREIAESFGEGVLAPDGSVDRKALGARVFENASERERLNRIVHPRIWQAIERFFERAKAKGAPLAVVDAALMVETGSYRKYDRLVVVYCPRVLQKERLMERDGLSSEQAEKRIGAQMPTEAKRELADYVVDTSGSLDETLERTDAVLERLRAEAGS